jgi:hypothetical protein
MITRPDVPSTITIVPGVAYCATPSMPDTAGMPKVRARIAAWE